MKLSKRIKNLENSSNKILHWLMPKGRRSLLIWPSYIILISFFLFLGLNLVFPLHDRIEYSTIITDNKGEVIHAFLTSDEQWRMKTELNEISPLLKKAIIEKEDRYFYYHRGINPLAACRAFVRNIFFGRRTSGASTITMQVARALHPQSRTYIHKIEEMFRATQLEWKYSKAEILQMYLNLVPYAGNIQGVKSASVIYLKKTPDHLSLAEIVALSVIPNRPSSLIPGKNNAAVVAERNRWLKRFSSEKIFDSAAIADALVEPFTASRGAAPHEVPQLAYKLRKQYGGAIIKTNIALNMQQKIEKLVKDHVRELYQKNIRQAAVMVIDNTTQKVVAYIGSADMKDTVDAGQVNGIDAIRQPGSTLKPLLYGLCVDAGITTPKMVISDVAINYNGYAPENYDRQFNGYVTMEYALEHSLNIPAVKSLNALGKDRLIDKLSVCGFKQVSKDRKKLGLSIILGGCGTTLADLTGMYSVFAHEGEFIQPSYLQTDTLQKLGIPVLSKAATFMINDILSKINRPDFPLNWQSTAHLPKLAWKTGTSYGRRDAWSIGYNRRYTVGVWVGNFSGLGIPELSGANVATPLLFKIFNTIDYNSDQEWFERPQSCDFRVVCSETGLPPGPACADKITDYFIPLVSPAKVCDNRQEIMVSPDEKMSFCRMCMPASGYKKKWYKIISPEMKAYFDERRIVYESVPPHNPACGKIYKEGIPVVTMPANGSEYLINRKRPEPLKLVCHVSNDVTKVYWYINNKFYKAADASSAQFFIPDEGPVKISCTDDKGRNRNIMIKVRYVDL